MRGRPTCSQIRALGRLASGHPARGGRLGRARARPRPVGHHSHVLGRNVFLGAGAPGALLRSSLRLWPQPSPSPGLPPCQCQCAARGHAPRRARWGQRREVGCSAAVQQCAARSQAGRRPRPRAPCAPRPSSAVAEGANRGVESPPPQKTPRAARAASAGGFTRANRLLPRCRLALTFCTSSLVMYQSPRLRAPLR